jgi:multidrug resistance efflux pump
VAALPRNLPGPKLRRALVVRLLVAAVVVAFVALVLIPRWIPPGSGDAPVALGTLEATEVSVSSEVNARVLSVAADEGQDVHAGDVLIRLDDAAIQLQSRQASAVDQQALAIQLAKYQLKAPSTGVVLRRDIQPGELAVVGAPLLAIGTLASLDLTVYVPQRDLDAVSLGQRVQVVAEALPAVAFDGQVRQIADRAEFTPRNAQTTNDRLNLAFGVKVRVSNARNQLKPGMTASALFLK